MTKPLTKVTVQPPYLTYNGKIDEFQYDHGSKTNNIFLKLCNASENIYSDQTGRVTIVSRKDSEYAMIVNEYNSNHIHGEPITSRNASDLTKVYEKLHKTFTSRGLHTQLHIIDNECSNLFKNFMTKFDENFQFMYPHLHQQNAAERVIQTFKNQFIAGISSVNKDLPVHIWCRLIPQACLVLNLLRQSRINPKLSA